MVKTMLTFRSKKNPFKYMRLQLYFYLARAYPKFFITGRCLVLPLIIQIQTQSYCNSRCLMCPYPVVSQRLEQGRMEPELYDKIIKEVTAQPLLAGIMYELHNELRLDKRLPNWIKHFKSNNPDNWCIVVTSGELLDTFSLQQIKETDIDQIMVSLNAHSRETYQLVNHGLDYERVTANILNLLADSDLKKRLQINFAVTENNIHEIGRAAQYWYEKGIKTRIMSIINRAGTLKDYKHFELKKEYKGQPLPFHLWRSFIDSLGRLTGCHHLFVHMNILFNGDVILCCHDWGKSYRDRQSQRKLFERDLELAQGQ